MVRQRAFGLVLFYFRLKLCEYMCLNGKKWTFSRQLNSKLLEFHLEVIIYFCNGTKSFNAVKNHIIYTNLNSAK